MRKCPTSVLVAASLLLGCGAGAPPPGGDDLAVASSPDFSSPADLAVPEDLVIPVDQIRPVDLVPPPDLAPLRDLTLPPDLVATCSNGLRDQDETDIDCGGLVCMPCPLGKRCLLDGDCQSVSCQAGTCVAPSCMDHEKNGTETDVDCGGLLCPACLDGKACLLGRDCVSLVCTAQTCRAATCMDLVKNGLETDVDCGGGKCSPCGDFKACLVAKDCASGVCTGKLCQQASCIDMVKNGQETDVDCGGPKCLQCSDGRLCAVDKDCVSGKCAGGKCEPAGCMNGIQDGNESDVDCGGRCPGCPLGKKCLLDSDCQSGSCKGGVCNSVLGTMANPAASCNDILLAGASMGDGLYWLDVGGGAFQDTCNMSIDGGGWTLLVDTYANSLVDGPNRMYLYLAGNQHWYESPMTSLAWDWNAGKQQTGTYSYFDGVNNSDYVCNGSGETPQFGVGCSNGPGGTEKTLPLYDSAPANGTCTICQDVPDAFMGGPCVKLVQIYIR